MLLKVITKVFSVDFRRYKQNSQGTKILLDVHLTKANNATASTKKLEGETIFFVATFCAT